jgi:hypothetical protein
MTMKVTEEELGLREADCNAQLHIGPEGAVTHACKPWVPLSLSLTPLEHMSLFAGPQILTPGSPEVPSFHFEKLL